MKKIRLLNSFLTRSVSCIPPMTHVKLSIQAACTTGGTHWHIYLMRSKHIFYICLKLKNIFPKEVTTIYKPITY